mmetsp:Transcript_27225/g.32204  ORF Transcript_27225/g.32204 Transcript_27225/m.32204 type:complete len:115 (+) Transcript_27225:33-377(+)
MITFILYKQQTKPNKKEETNHTISNDLQPTNVSPSTLFFNIESDSSDYLDIDDDCSEESTDEDLVTMTPEEKEDTKYQKYITPEMLVMLQHEFSTQKNESLNHSVATLAAKGKD